MTKSSKHVCSSCNNSFATRQSLWNHKQRCRGLRYDEQNRGRCYNNASPIINVAASKIICEKKVGEKQPHCNEIIHFNSNEFKDGEPKTLETLNKITKVVNSELSPLIPPKKKIGMGVDTILAAPAIGFVHTSVPGVPGRIFAFDEHFNTLSDDV